MLIDWFTVAAQLINFLILLWLLKRLLYKPILNAMQARREKVAAALEDARAEREAAEAKRQELVEERRSLAEAKDAMLAEARAEVERWQESALSRARADVASARRQWQDGLERERSRDLEELRAGVARAVMAVSAKVLDDLADHELAGHVARTFLDRLEAARASGEDARAFAQGGRVTVKVPPVLDNDDRAELSKRLTNLFSQAAAIDMAEDETIDFGLRIVAGDHKWDWNLTTYLRELEMQVFGQLARRSVPAPSPSEPDLTTAEPEAAT